MEKSSPIKFYQRDDGIIVFEFKALHKPAADLFRNIVLAGVDTDRKKLRVIYDFSKSPPPTPYFLQIQAKVYNEYPHPEDSKSAYVTNVATDSVWVKIVRGYVNGDKDVAKAFTSQDNAIAWLLDD